MKRALQFFGGLVLVVLLHLIGTRLFDYWSLLIDLMLVVTVFNALDSSPLGGMWGGFAAGWATDALVGTSYGIFGLTGTIIGYGVALAVQRVVIHRAVGAALLFALASAAQQGLVLGLSLLLLTSPEIPDGRWMLYKIATTGLVGAALFVARQHLVNRVDLWRHTRRTRIRLDR